MLKHNTFVKTIPNRVVVMGAGGFVGASLVKNLYENKIPFLALTEKNMNLFDAEASDRLSNILHPYDTLVVISAIAPCKNNEMLLQNISMMKAVCDAIEKKQPKHLIYLSSDAVYADRPNPLTETSNAEPGSIHGIMHLCREIMLKQVCSVPMAILRPSLLYGAEDTHNGYGPNQFLRLAFSNKEITLFGEGEERRDHVYIDDLVNLLRLIILHYSEGVLNIATGTAVSFREIAEMVSEYFNPPTIINTIPRLVPMPHNGYRPFDNSASLASFPDFRYTTLADGIEKTFRRLKSKS
ncbi:MAG: NAD(P)-dependent oxidoreductase [Bacteroidetes bacterium]|nr:NAD(P)-dependent oxidoreductase [Bacteroidota bacterium]